MQPNKTSLLRNQSRAFHNAGYKSKPRDANDILRTNGAGALRCALDGAAPITLPAAGRKRTATGKSSELASEETWQNPDLTLLEDRRGELPEFPIDVLDPASRKFSAASVGRFRPDRNGPTRGGFPFMVRASAYLEFDRWIFWHR
jgi:hypothetical protein